MCADHHRFVIQPDRLALRLTSNLEVGADTVLAATELLYAALADAGLPSQYIVAAADLLVDYLNGLALTEINHLKQTAEPLGLPTLLGRYPPEQFPVMRRIFQLTENMPPSGVETEVDIIIASVEFLRKATGTQF